MPSFDVVSKLDWAEVQNALTQASKEVAQRFDFKGTNPNIERTETGFLITASSEDRVKAVYDVLQEKLIRRKVSLKHFEADEPLPGPKMTAKMTVKVAEGIDVDKGRELVKLVKATKIKVQAAMHEEMVRISGKKRDDLQNVMAELRKADIGIDLQFNNFRD
jgi:uncharacterized protein YajQ (UPF0234 family)